MAKATDTWKRATSNGQLATATGNGQLATATGNGVLEALLSKYEAGDTGGQRGTGRRPATGNGILGQLF